MKSRFLIASLVVFSALGLLISSAVRESKKQVMTVQRLVSEGNAQKNIRLGARVSDLPFDYKTSPELTLRFSVRDQLDAAGEKLVPVVYNGPLPETLKSGRDVILEGDFDGKEFRALTLQTQCPSKYEPPAIPAG